MTLGQRIQELRKQAGLSQEGLGEALGVSRQAVSKWEGDNGIPELDTLIAMSKLFGVTLGQLLGVEEAAPPEEEPASAMDEEKVEAILRRYVEESRRQEPAQKNNIGVWIVAVCGCILLAAVAVAAIFGQVREVKESVDTLWSNVASIESYVTNMRNQMGDLSSNIRDQVSEALEEKNNLISTFDYEVFGFDLREETVDLRLTATLKEYTPGSQVQFVLDWQKTDETKGQTVTEPASGPEFTAEVTIPMNFHLDISLREVLPDGGHREQKVNVVYSGMHPENFSFDVGGIFDPLALKRVGWYGTQSIKGSGWINVYGGNPELLWPVSVNVKYVLTNPRSEDEKTEENFDLELVNTSYGLWSYGYREPQDWTVSAGASFDATVTIVDNLGRTFIFRDSSFVDAKGEWSETPGAIRVDQDPEIIWPD